MSLFHDEEDGDGEPTRGLPQKLPDDETIVWQGKPSGFRLAVEAFRIRWIAAYFAVFAAWKSFSLAASGAPMSEILGGFATLLVAAVAGGSIILALGVLMARAALYTVTTKRVVLRYGVAIRKYVNVPFAIIEAAALKSHGGDAGSIALKTSAESKIGYLHLWPFARPFRFARPEPMLRALPVARAAADALCAAMKRRSPATVSIVEPERARVSASPAPAPAAA